ncbi:RDD family protein [Pareuzebyella sediminis]|uniref:RDD family protein n=1 Tax=Pareuzebyella sediminis TaxID=2607998 RepID=UPI0011EEF9BF|nr:RDD family protein [Pareuzebyella sediminis]
MIVTSQPNLTRRIIAGLVDYVLIFCFTIIYTYTIGEPNEEGGYGVSGFLALGPVLIWGVMTVGIEQWFGRTIGNSLVELKPKSINGLVDSPIFLQSLQRHLLDPIDMSFLGIVGIISINATEKNQRLGDIWAKTVVVRTDNKENE